MTAHRSFAAAACIARVSTMRALLVVLTLALAPLSSAAHGAEGVDGLRRLEGRYVRIFTDLPETPEHAGWPSVFDAAVPRWCAFWNIPPEQLDGWRVDAYVMSAKQPFLERGLIPPELPDFPHGFQQGNRLWVVAQPSDYYTRHLLLHEGAHAFAFRAFGGAGPAWYMEGTAELLATHRWDGQTLDLSIVPESRQASPYWGRFRLIDQRRSAGQTLSLVAVMRYSDPTHRQVEPYAWTWAAASMFAADPRCRQVMIAAARRGRDTSPEFTRQFVQALEDRWPVAQAWWRLMIEEFDYGYDLGANAIPIAGDEPLWDGQPLRVDIHADRGWQSVGVKIPAGTPLSISARGRVTVAQDPVPWEAEPQGVTIRYHDGHPLGQLMAVLLPTATPGGTVSPPLDIRAIGRGGEIVAREESWLLLKVGDSPAELSDNQGAFQVEIAAP